MHSGVGSGAGGALGTADGIDEEDSDGEDEGRNDSAIIGDALGFTVGFVVGCAEGSTVGERVGEAVDITCGRVFISSDLAGLSLVRLCIIGCSTNVIATNAAIPTAASSDVTTIVNDTQLFFFSPSPKGSRRRLGWFRPIAPPPSSWM